MARESLVEEGLSADAAIFMQNTVHFYSVLYRPKHIEKTNNLARISNVSHFLLDFILAL